MYQSEYGHVVCWQSIFEFAVFPDVMSMACANVHMMAGPVGPGAGRVDNVPQSCED